MARTRKLELAAVRPLSDPTVHGELDPARAPGPVTTVTVHFNEPAAAVTDSGDVTSAMYPDLSRGILQQITSVLISPDNAFDSE